MKLKLSKISIFVISMNVLLFFLFIVGKIHGLSFIFDIDEVMNINIITFIYPLDIFFGTVVFLNAYFLKKKGILTPNFSKILYQLGGFSYWLCHFLFLLFSAIYLFTEYAEYKGFFYSLFFMFLYRINIHALCIELTKRFWVTPYDGTHV